MKHEVYQVDAFSRVPFRGNPAAVCLLPPSDQPLDDATRLSIAAEMNLSETAFVEPVPGPGGSAQGNASPFGGSNARFRLRWFTPAAEVPLCGHATLASAHVLWTEAGNTSQQLEFSTLSGTLVVQRVQQQGTTPPLLRMDLPLAAPSDPLPAALGGSSSGGGGGCAPLDSKGLRALLSAALGEGHPPVAAVQFNAALKYLLVVLGPGQAPAQLEAMEVVPARLAAAASKQDLTGLILTCAGTADGPHDYYARFFAPWVAIDEDPVTGSAHCVCGAFWSQQLGKDSLFARQCSARGGDVWVHVQAAAGRVAVSGQAVTVLRGVLDV